MPPGEMSIVSAAHFVIDALAASVDSFPQEMLPFLSYLSMKAPPGESVWTLTNFVFGVFLWSAFADPVALGLRDTVPSVATQTGLEQVHGVVLNLAHAAVLSHTSSSSGGGGGGVSVSVAASAPDTHPASVAIVAKNKTLLLSVADKILSVSARLGEMIKEMPPPSLVFTDTLTLAPETSTSEMVLLHESLLNYTPDLVDAFTHKAVGHMSVSDTLTLSLSLSHFAYVFENPENLPRVLQCGNFIFLNELYKCVDTKEKDSLCRAAISLLEPHGGVMELIKWAIDSEVSLTEREETLFRADNIATKLTKIYSGLVGTPYLRVLLSDDMHTLCSDTHAVADYEVDPYKIIEQYQRAHPFHEDDPVAESEMTPEIKERREKKQAAYEAMCEEVAKEKQKANMDRLLGVTKQLLVRIFKSATELPSELLEICAHLASAVQARFPQSTTVVNTAIGGFIFLRFVVSAVMAPEKYDLVETPPGPDARRALVLIAKVLQNVSNGAPFDGAKEMFMTPANSFVMDNIPDVREFFHALLTTKSALSGPARARRASRLPVRALSYDADQRALFGLISRHIDSLSTALAPKLRHALLQNEALNAVV
eukprot:TRINITY_DN2632_c0_g1_i1.p1 TRINITY_DN2632_c0_g1~~TRINITY_DN2632_c0_g1_i1.p1  ORF type:complete len:596 (+),score=177.88 TRINITY_DN2632_c0_g1_i1:170-1957(+)